MTERGEDAEDYMCHLVTNAEIKAGAEVFNTYGEGLGNARLAARYGFLTEANEEDRCTFTFEEVAQGVDLSSWRSLFQLWTASFPPSPSDSPLVKFDPEGNLFVDADAKLSSSLWLLLVLACNPSLREWESPEQLTFLRRLDEALSVRWGNLEEEETGASEELIPPVDRDNMNRISQAVVSLVNARAAKGHEPNLTAEEVLDLAEVSPFSFAPC